MSTPIVKPERAKVEARGPQMDVEHFWAAAADNILLIKTCNDCQQVHFYPRMLCPYCLSENLAWTPVSGQGEIYSCSTLMTKDGPGHTLAFVRLDEGVTLMTNIVDADPRGLHIGQRVQAVFRRLRESGPVLPLFTPVLAADAQGS